jgi:hypothetical protein
VSVNGIALSGYSEGTFIMVEREEDSYTKVVGSDGKVTRSKNANKSGSIALTLKASSASNDVISGFSAKDEIDGSGVFMVIVKDNSGRSIHSGKGWIRKPANAEYAKEVSDREWTFDIANLMTFQGGNEEQ